MNIGKLIYFKLSTDSTISGYVGTRIFPSAYINDSSNHQVPYITYQKVSQDPNNTKNNASEYDYFVYQINVIHDKYSETVEIAEKIRDILDYFGGETIEQVNVDKIFFESSSDVYYDNAGSTGLFGISSDYRFNIKREVSFLPTSLDGLQLWLSNNTGVVLDSDGTGVIQWTDQSDNSNNATQNEANDTNQPTSANGGITFDGSNDYLLLNNEISLNEFHIFIALALDDHSVETIFGETEAGDFLRFGQGGLNNYIRFQAQASQFDFSGFTPVISDDGTKQLFEFSRNSGTTDNAILTINGTEHATKASSDTSSFPFEIDAIGVRNTTNTQYTMDGVIFEVIIFNSVLSTANATKVRDYINEKLNIYV